MGHATYLFLMDLGYEAEFGRPMAEEKNDAFLLEYALEQFRSDFDPRLDDNNWWNPIHIVFPDRPGVLAENVQDDRTAHELLEEQTKSAETFNKRIADSWLYNAADFSYEVKGLAPETLPISEHKKAREEFQARLRAQLLSYHADPSTLPGSGDNDQSLAKWMKNRLLRGISFANNCRLGGFTKSKRATPYGWRSFDIRRNAKAKPNAILYLDIHT